MTPRRALVLAGALALIPLAALSAGPAQADDDAATSVPRATCGPGASLEPGLQGQVPSSDRQNGRSRRVTPAIWSSSVSTKGEGTTWVNPQYKHCAYKATAFAGISTKKSQGVQVIDASNPRKPKLAAALTSPAMLTGTW